jgi:hypothetical protein
MKVEGFKWESREGAEGTGPCMFRCSYFFKKKEIILPP